MSIMKQLQYVPSAKIIVECGFLGMMRPLPLASMRDGFFCFFSSQLSLLASRLRGRREAANYGGSDSITPSAISRSRS